MGSGEYNDDLNAHFLIEIEEALRAKDWKRMESWSKRWIQLNQNDHRAFHWLARAYLAQKNFQRAAYSYNRVLDLDKNNVEARRFFRDYPSLSEGEQKAPTLENKKNSASDLSVTPEKRKIIAECELNSAQAYEKENLFSDGAERYRKSFHWKASRESALGYARCLHRSHQSHQAIKFLRERLYQSPDWIEGRVLLGKLFFELDQKTSAQREWQTVLTLDKNNLEALNFLRGFYESI